ncbi:hypothetical protein ACLESD_27690 [Pyxidicoccus sp. 3LFB2]
MSTVLGFSLVGGAGCAPAPEQEAPTPAPSPELTRPAPTPEQEQQDEERTVTAMAVSNITWADMERTTTAYYPQCVTGVYAHTCSQCAYDPKYSQEYSMSGCTSPSDWQHMCYTCDKQYVPYQARVQLPDGDIINVTIEHGVTASDGVEFRLESGPNVTWWKQVTIIGGGETWRVWNQDGNSWCDWPYPSTNNCNTNSQWASIVADPSTRFVFSKAKGIFAVHEDKYVLFNLSERLTGGDRVTFRWVQD